MYIIIIKMTQDSKKIIAKFLTNYFSIKRKKIKSKNWSRVVTIPGGYIRSTTKTYQWTRSIDLHMIVVDLAQIIENVFGCASDEAQKLALSHLQILNDTRTLATPATRTRRPIRTTPRR